MWHVRWNNDDVALDEFACLTTFFDLFPSPFTGFSSDRLDNAATNYETGCAFGDIEDIQIGSMQPLESRSCRESLDECDSCP